MVRAKAGGRKTTHRRAGAPCLSFIIVAWNRCELTLGCLRSIFENVQDVGFEVLLVDNASTDGTAEIVGREFPDVTVLVNKAHLGFAAANNVAIARARGRLLVLLNTDTKLTPGAVETMVDFMDSHPDVGVAGPQLLNEDGSKQNSIANFPCLATEFVNKALLRLLLPSRHPSKYFGHDSPIDVESIIGACMVIRAEAAREIGLFDEDYYFFLEETDFCFRLKQKGWRVCHVPQAGVYHLKGASAEQRPGSAARIEYCRSMYTFFEKNRSPAESRALRRLYSLKLLVESVVHVYSCAFTLACHADSRRRLGRYWDLVRWHWRLCPDSQGLGGNGSRRRQGGMEGGA